MKKQAYTVIDKSKIDNEILPGDQYRVPGGTWRNAAITGVNFVSGFEYRRPCPPEPTLNSLLTAETNAERKLAQARVDLIRTERSADAARAAVRKALLARIK